MLYEVLFFKKKSIAVVPALVGPSATIFAIALALLPYITVINGSF